MPTEQQPAFVTKRDTDFTLQNCKSPDEYEYRIANMLQNAMTLLGEKCECDWDFDGIFHVCQPCHRKAKLLRVWNGEEK